MLNNNETQLLCQSKIPANHRIRSIHPLYNEEIMNQLREKERDLYINSVEQLEPLERLMSLQNSMSKVDKDTL